MSEMHLYERLGAARFQTLVNTLLRAIHTDNFESFREGKDGGADGVVKLEDNKKQVIQSKFKTKAATHDAKIFSELKSALKLELEKPEVTSNQTVKYLYVSNYPFSHAEKKELESCIRERHPHLTCVIWGRTDLDEQLLLTNIRFSFPELLNYTALQELIQAGFQEKQKTYAMALTEGMRTFISTNAFRRSLNKLNQQNFVILAGPPKAGKTCTAEALALTFAMKGFRPYEILDPKEFFEAIATPGKAILICDDVFGDIAHRYEKSEAWSRDFKTAIRTLNADKKLIWTSRSYILSEAISETKVDEALKGQKNLLLEIDITELTIEEKAQIVKSHFKSANLDPETKSILIELAPKIVKHSNFNPESVRTLALEEFAKSILLGGTDIHKIWRHIDHFLNRPGESLKKVFRTCSEGERFLLKTLLIAGDNLEVTALKQTYQQAQVTDRALNPFDEAFAKITNSFVKIRGQTSSSPKVFFHHPSIKDMILDAVNAEMKERLAIIPRLSFDELVSHLFPKPKPAAWVNDHSISHRIKFTTADEVGQLRARFKSEFGNEKLNVKLNVLRESTGVNADPAAREFVLANVVNEQFVRELLHESFAAHAQYFTAVVSHLEQANLTIIPPLGIEFVSSMKIQTSEPSFWNFIHAYSKIFPIFSKKITASIDTEEFLSGLLAESKDLLDNVPSEEPDSYSDWELIQDWKDSVEALATLANAAIRPLAYSETAIELENVVLDLEAQSGRFPEFDTQDEHRYDEWKEERNFELSIDEQIRAVIRDED